MNDSYNLSRFLEFSTQKIWDLTRNYIPLKEEFPFDDDIIYINSFVMVGIYCQAVGITPTEDLIRNSTYRFKKHPTEVFKDSIVFMSMIEGLDPACAIKEGLTYFEQFYINRALNKSKKKNIFVPDIVAYAPQFRDFLTNLIKNSSEEI